MPTRRSRRPESSGTRAAHHGHLGETSPRDRALDRQRFAGRQQLLLDLGVSLEEGQEQDLVVVHDVDDRGGRAELVARRPDDGRQVVRAGDVGRVEQLPKGGEQLLSVVLSHRPTRPVLRPQTLSAGLYLRSVAGWAG